MRLLLFFTKNRADVNSASCIHSVNVPGKNKPHLHPQQSRARSNLHGSYADAANLSHSPPTKKTEKSRFFSLFLRPKNRFDPIFDPTHDNSKQFLTT